jgi:hypothetical protein
MYSLFMMLLAWGAPHPTTLDACVELVPEALGRTSEQRLPAGFH